MFKEDGTDVPDQLYVMDWNGHLLCRYSMDRRFSGLSLDGEKLYLTHYIGAAAVVNTDTLKAGLNVGSPFVTFLDENRLIMLNLYYFKNKNLGINNGASRFIINEKDIDPNFNRVNSRLYYTYNVSQGFIVPNIEKDRIIYASNFYDEIEIYDCDLHLLRRIEGPDNLIPSYQIHNREIIFNKTVPYTYRNYAITDDFFYLSYIGDYYTSGSQLQDFDSWILKFDWDGNFIECYHSEEYVSTISLSDTDGKFYARGLDQKGVPVVLELIKTL